MQDDNPLDVIAAVPPEFSAGNAIDIARTHYGLNARAERLVSERDCNYRLDANDGRRYVLKIANAAEDPLVTDFQVQALMHIAHFAAAKALPVEVPAIVPALDGSASIAVDSGQGTHVARVVTWVDGTPLDGGPVTTALARDMGRALAHLGLALAGFEHEGSRHSLLWDLQQAHAIRPLFEHIENPSLREVVNRAIDEFEREALPAFPALRRQVIHSDLNTENVLLRNDDSQRVAGIIDFGDMLEAPLVADVAIGACYLRGLDGHPLQLIAEFVAGYHAVQQLEDAEIDLLFTLIKARLAASIAILYWRVAARADDDPYLGKLLKAENSAEKFLPLIEQIPPGHARRVFRQVCASAGQPEL